VTYPLVVAVLVLALFESACQRAMSVDEAKQVTARFAGRAFVPPPRTINDIMTILEQGKRMNPDAVANATEWPACRSAKAIGISGARCPSLGRQTKSARTIRPC